MPIYLEVVFRSIAGFIIVVLAGRLIGQKLNVLIGVAVGAFAALFSLDPRVDLLSILLSIGTWTVLYILTSYICLKSYNFRKLVNGKPTVLIEQGKVLEDNLKKARVTVNDMMAMLREKNAFKLSEVEFGVLEADGQMSVMKKSESNPVTPVTQGIPVENERAPRVVVIDGKVLNKTLEDLGYSQGWLWGELLKQGMKSINDVVLAQVDAKGNVYVDLKSDTLKPSPIKSKPLLLASLKKLEADLELFAMQTENPAAKQDYEACASSLQGLIKHAEPLLRE